MHLHSVLAQRLLRFHRWCKSMMLVDFQMSLFYDMSKAWCTPQCAKSCDCKSFRLFWDEKYRDRLNIAQVFNSIAKLYLNNSVLFEQQTKWIVMFCAFSIFLSVLNVDTYSRLCNTKTYKRRQSIHCKLFLYVFWKNIRNPSRWKNWSRSAE